MTTTEQARIALFLLATLFELSGSTHDKAYVEPACQHERNVVYHLGSSGDSTALIIQPRREGYGANNNCNVTVSADNIRKGHVMLTIRRIDFENPFTCDNYLRIYNGTTFINKLCGNSDPDSSDKHFTVPRANFMMFYFHTDTWSIYRRGFEIVATAYTDGPCSGSFNFRCKNLNCISTSLVCDGYNNCGDNSDETNESPARCALGAAAVAGIVIGVLLFIAIVAGVIWFFQRRRTKATIIHHTPAVNPTVHQGYQQSPDGIQNPTYGIYPSPPPPPPPPYSK